MNNSECTEWAQGVPATAHRIAIHHPWTSRVPEHTVIICQQLKLGKVSCSDMVASPCMLITTVKNTRRVSPCIIGVSPCIIDVSTESLVYCNLWCIITSIDDTGVVTEQLMGIVTAQIHTSNKALGYFSVPNTLLLSADLHLAFLFTD